MDHILQRYGIQKKAILATTCKDAWENLYKDLYKKVILGDPLTFSKFIHLAHVSVYLECYEERTFNNLLTRTTPSEVMH